MRRNWIPKRVLSVIVAASLVMSTSITAAASPVDASDEVEKIEEQSDVNDSKDLESNDDLEEEMTSKDDSESEEKNEDDTDDSEEEDCTEEGECDVLTPEESDFTLVDNEAITGNINNQSSESPVEEHDSEEMTRVIIVFDGDSVLDEGYDTKNLANNKSAMSESDNIEADQEKNIDQLCKNALEGQDLEVNYSFSILTNAVSADIQYKYIEEIEKVDCVESVIIAEQYEPQKENDAQLNTITSGDMVGSYNTWAAGYTGAGTRIAVIDTGIDIDHPSFDGGAFDYHLQETAKAAGKKVADYKLLNASEIKNALPNLNASKRCTGATSDKLYQNEKVPYAFNYVDKNFNITHENDSQGDHGTHVSGIATANQYVPDSTSKTGYSKQSAGVVGVAPDAQLISMKVYGATGGGYTDDYIAAIEDAILLKADAINLSFGTNAVGYSSDAQNYVNKIFDKLEDTSTVLSVSAGNSGRWGDHTNYGANLTKNVNQDTIGSPASYTNSLAVASAINSGMTDCNIQLKDGRKFFYLNPDDSVADEITTLDTKSTGTEYSFVYLTSYGYSSDYKGLDVKGKIVFVSRGDITFAEKQKNAASAGAKALVVYNNVAGIQKMSLVGSSSKLPTVSISQADGQAVQASGTKNKNGAYEGTVTVNKTPGTQKDMPNGYTMSDFSSYGVPGTLDLKPEITAPGENVYSTRDNGTYGNLSGTSMSTPSISGQTALIQQYIRENNLTEKTGLSTRALTQSLMMSTATPLYEGNDKNGLEYSPRCQGAGLANVKDAVTTPSYILVGDKDGNDGKVKAVLGDDPAKTGAYSFTFDIYNMTDATQYYVLDSSVLTEEIFDEDGNKVFKGQSHKLNPTVSITASDSKLVYDLNDDGKVDMKDRKTFLSIVNGSNKSALVTQNQKYFDFNNDGVVNTKDIYKFSKQLKGGAKVADLGLKLTQVKESTKITVSIKLSASDKQYLSSFENGMYVDGFVYVNGNVDMSVPFLAFYGNWADSPMFEDFDYMEYVHNSSYFGNTYLGQEKTNYISYYPFGNSNAEPFVPNYFTEDDKYIADRTAFSTTNGTKLGSQYFSLIRNASRMVLTVKNQETGEKYLERVTKANNAEFYSPEQDAWSNTVGSVPIVWSGKDATGNPVENGTKIEVSLQAIPEYYDDVKDVSTLNSEGMFLKTTFVVDNERPVIKKVVKNSDGKVDITVHDNRYVASILVIKGDKSGLYGKYAVNQETLGEDMTVTVDVPEGDFYIEVIDYALNENANFYNSEKLTTTSKNDSKLESVKDKAENNKADKDKAEKAKSLEADEAEKADEKSADKSEEKSELKSKDKEQDKNKDNETDAEPDDSVQENNEAMQDEEGGEDDE